MWRGAKEEASPYPKSGRGEEVSPHDSALTFHRLADVAAGFTEDADPGFAFIQGETKDLEPWAT